MEKICGPSHEELKQATSNAVELLALSGRIIPYPVGPLGVIAEGTYADILLVDCNPVEDAMIMTGYKNDFDLIMKDGVIYKNTLDRVSHGVTENRRTAQRFSKPQEENK
ncbi:hypothetical protein [Shimia abyssi]|uniref:hypothetical protein n=1 Tax=Shimia abyssi TaxID=1662395 RepID=UPI001A9D001F|nr:hypothetical protein [Shimia abyssi]